MEKRYDVNSVFEDIILEGTREDIISNAKELFKDKFHSAEKLIANKDVDEKDRITLGEKYSDAKIVVMGIEHPRVIEKAELHLVTPEKIVEASRNGLIVPLMRSNSKRENPIDMDTYAQGVVITGGLWKVSLKLFYGMIDGVEDKFNTMLETESNEVLEDFLNRAKKVGISEEKLSPKETLELSMRQVQGLLG